MYSKRKWIPKIILAAAIATSLASVATAQVRIHALPLSLLPPDEARDIFNDGQAAYDENRFREAENKFREVIRRFPKNAITDRADYYLIRTLADQGKQKEALTRIDAFRRLYPQSKWQDEVLEFRIQLTNQVPATAEALLLPRQAPTAPSPRPAPSRVPNQVVAVSVGPPPAPPAPPQVPQIVRIGPFGSAPTPGAVGPFGPSQAQSSDPEVSLLQEMMSALFRNNFDSGLAIATERLKANPADPVVLSSLHVVASSNSAQAVTMLQNIAKSSTNPKARGDAIFWLGQSHGDKDAIVDTLTSLLPTATEEDANAVAYSLSQIKNDKAINALSSIARDKGKSEKARNNAVFWIGQSRAMNRVSLLEDVYKNSMDNSKIRQQVMFALSQVHDAQAVTVLSNVVSSDPDIEVRKQAVFWLGQIRSPEAGQALEKLLQKK
jgi:TolA-binding protein